MNIKQVEEKLVQLIEPVVASEGLELWDLIFRREPHGWVVRVMIEKEGGVTHEDCELVSRQLGDLLDVEGVIERVYHLEVSSPGLDRPLKQESHFQRFIGREAKITTRTPLAGQRHFKGKILAVKDQKVILEDRTWGERTIPLELLEKANLLPDYEGAVKSEKSIGKKKSG